MNPELSGNSSTSITRSHRSAVRDAVPRIGQSASRAWLLARRSVTEFLDDDCHQVAAGISYYGLLSLFPVVILTVGLFGIVVERGDARERVIDTTLDNLPLRPGEGRQELRELLESVTADFAAFGVVGVLALLVSATGLMGAIRHGINTAFDVEERRPLVRGKLLDVLLVLCFGLVVAASLALTLVVRLAADTVGVTGLGLGQVAPVALSFVVFLAAYRFLPARDTSVRDVWPGALLAAVGYEAAKTGFGVYLDNFGNYGAVYGSIGAIIAFLFFVFVSANVFLLGAEAASEWPRARDRAGRGRAVTREPR